MARAVGRTNSSTSSLGTLAHGWQTHTAPAGQATPASAQPAATSSRDFLK